MRLHGLITKMSVPTVLVLMVAIAATLVYVPQRLEHNIVSGVTREAERTVRQFKTLRAYYTQNIVKKALASGALKPAIDHQGREDGIPLPATMIHDLSELLNEQGTTIRLYSEFPFPNRRDRPLDAFEHDAWSALNTDASRSFVERHTLEGREVVRVAVADTMVSEVCVACHNKHPDTPKNDWQLNDVRGVLEVTTDITEPLAAGRLTTLSILSLLTGVLVAILAAFYLTYQRVVGSKVQHLNQAIAELAEGGGDLTRRLDERGADELCDVARSFNRFTTNTGEMIRQIAQSGEQVAHTADEMFGAVSETQVRVERQREETQHVVTAVGEMSAAARIVADSAQEADEAAQRMHDEADKGQMVILQTITSVEELTEAVQQAVGVVSSLADNSHEISGVLDVIRGIAEQTNLLALNAAIEAARAGEQGRGFAVVSDEVRLLASRTQESTEEIQSMIERLQHGTQEAVNVMDRGARQADTSLARAADARVSIEAITASVNTITDLNAQIASAAEEQSNVTSTLEANLEAITEASSAVSRAADENALKGKQLGELGNELQSTVSRFKLA